MSRPAVLTAVARDDLLTELRWIGPDNVAKARRLCDALEIAARRIGSYPYAGRLEAALLPSPYRFWSIPSLQVVLVYNAATEPPRILRLLSTARDLAPLLADIGREPR